MITYVNTVFVGHNKGICSAAPTASDTGKYYIVDQYGKICNSAELAAAADELRIGFVSKKKVAKVNHTTHEVTYVPAIKWANPIKKNDVKSVTYSEYKPDVLESVNITVPTAIASYVGYRVVVRLTFKDLPTRYRKWSESYEVFVTGEDTNATIASKIAATINEQYKRARVLATIAEATPNVVTLTAMPYDDDDTEDTINVAETNRFSVNVWMTNPNGTGFSAKNKYGIPGLTIVKTPGEVYQGSAKLVRDLEAQAMGYQGILNRGEGTWPIIKPEMETTLKDENGDPEEYNSLTIEYENLYRAADDIFRKTKETINIFETGSYAETIKEMIDAFKSGVAPAEEEAED